jgi:hypothetical protein
LVIRTAANGTDEPGYARNRLSDAGVAQPRWERPSRPRHVAATSVRLVDGAAPLARASFAMEVCFHGRRATWCYCLSCRVELSTSTSTPAMSRVLGLRSASSRSTRHSENMWCRSRRLPSATITDHMSDPIRNLTEGEVEFFGEHGWLHVRGWPRRGSSRGSRRRLPSCVVRQAHQWWPRRRRRPTSAVAASQGATRPGRRQGGGRQLVVCRPLPRVRQPGPPWVRPDDDLRDQRRWLTKPRGQSSAWCQRAALVMG